MKYILLTCLVLNLALNCRSENTLNAESLSVEINKKEFSDSVHLFFFVDIKNNATVILSKVYENSYNIVSVTGTFEYEFSFIRSPVLTNESVNLFSFSIVMEDKMLVAEIDLHSLKYEIKEEGVISAEYIKNKNKE